MQLFNEHLYLCGRSFEVFLIGPRFGGKFENRRIHRCFVSDSIGTRKAARPDDEIIAPSFSQGRIADVAGFRCQNGHGAERTSVHPHDSAPPCHGHQRNPNFFGQRNTAPGIRLPPNLPRDVPHPAESKEHLTITFVWYRLPNGGMVIFIDVVAPKKKKKNQ